MTSREQLCRKIISVVLCPLVVICGIGWLWLEFPSSPPRSWSCFKESPFQILSWPIPTSCVAGRCGDLVVNPCPQSLLHSQLWWSSNNMDKNLHGQNDFSFLPCSCFIRKVLKNQLLTIACAATDYGKCLGQCCKETSDGLECFCSLSSTPILGKLHKLLLDNEGLGWGLYYINEFQCVSTSTAVIFPVPSHQLRERFMQTPWTVWFFILLSYFPTDSL